MPSIVIGTQEEQLRAAESDLRAIQEELRVSVKAAEERLDRAEKKSRAAYKVYVASRKGGDTPESKRAERAYNAALEEQAKVDAERHELYKLARYFEDELEKLQLKPGEYVPDDVKSLFARTRKMLQRGR